MMSLREWADMACMAMGKPTSGNRKWSTTNSPATQPRQTRAKAMIGCRRRRTSARTLRDADATAGQTGLPRLPVSACTTR